MKAVFNRFLNVVLLTALFPMYLFFELSYRSKYLEAAVFIVLIVLVLRYISGNGFKLWVK